MLEFIQISFLEDPIQACAEIAMETPTRPHLFVGSIDDEVDAFISAAEGHQFVKPAEGAICNGMKCSSKKAHMSHLLSDGENIAIKNSLFKYCDDAMLRIIRCNGYQLIAPGDSIIWADTIKGYREDNVVEAINRKQLIAVAQEAFLLSPAHKAEYVLEMLNIPKFTYTGRLLIRLMCKGHTAMCWGLHPLLFDSFLNAFIVHQMPSASTLMPYLNLMYTPYTIRAKESSLGIPNPSLLQIVQDERYNQRGEEVAAYSSHWYSSNKKVVDDVFKDMLNVLVHSDTNGEKRKLVAYTMPNDVLNRVDENRIRSVFRGRGFRATQQYSNKDYSSARFLCYCANPFFSSSSANFLRKNGIDFDQDAYALYHMLRWISQSAVRNEETVTLYIPSKRMRDILEHWMGAHASQTDSLQ